MEENSTKKSSLLEAMIDGVYVIREDYTITYTNQTMESFFGKGIGQKCYRYINQRDDKCSWCHAEEVFKGETHYYELNDPGTNKIFSVTSLPLKNEDGTTSILSIFRDITLIRQREEKLRRSETYYRNLFEHVGCGVFVSTKEGKFIDANPAMIDMLGYKDKEDFLQMDIVQNLYMRAEDRLRFQKMIERDGKVVDYEVYLKKKDGTPISVLLTAHVRYDNNGNILGYEGINVDQTQRKQMESDIKEAHDFLHEIIQNSPNAIMAANMKGDIFIWNKASEETLGYKSEDVIGKINIVKIYPEEGMAKKVMRMLRAKEFGGVGRLNSFPIVHIKKDGTRVDGHLSAALIYDSKGNEIASVGIVVDLTERLTIERQLRTTQEQLLQSEKLAAMGRLTSQLAHELNNPLYGIMNTLELLKTEIPPQSKRRKVLEMALSETVRLSDMLRKMLSFSKPDQEERKPVDINEILDEILLLHEKQLQENSIKIQTSFDQNIGNVFASKNQLRQVFLNMISNAKDAMPEGGKFIVKTSEYNGFIKVEIIDTGIGMKKDDIDRIFDAFFTTKDSVKGVGLGLSVCYGFIIDHGGDIEVTSTEGEGTTFTISLPVHKE